MTELLTFGMVTILLLTLVSNSTLPLKLWSSNTTAPYSTWEGQGNQLSNGMWSPAGHVTTFRNTQGLKVQKLQQGQLTNIHNSLNGILLNGSTNIPDSVFQLQNDGNIVQLFPTFSTVFLGSSLTAPLWAPIQLANGTSTRCITASGTNNVTSLNPCMGRISTQQWMLRSNKQVFNNGTGLCLDVAADNSARSNTCVSTKSTQQWRWENGYLKLSATGKCLKVKSAIGTSFSLETGLCDGPRMVWNK